MLATLFFTIMACKTGALDPAIKPISTDVSGHPLKELELNLPQYGVAPSVYPLKKSSIAGSPYGWRIHPIKNTQSLHRGQDIPCKKGTAIKAVAGGTVVISRKSDTAGKYIEIEHPSQSHTVTTRYLHLRVRHVKEGDTVAMGQIIGSCGSTGNSTGPHLHFEIKVDGTAVPPFYLK